MTRELALVIEALDDEGRGVGTADGRRVHVPGALPGETVRATVVHDSPHGVDSWATYAGLVGPPARDRVTPRCPGHGRCGGCTLQHLAYRAQLAFKRQRVERTLQAAGLAAVVVDDVVASPREYGYRNKAKYVIAPAPASTAGGPGDLQLGSWAPGTHELVPMAGCQVPEAPLDEIAQRALALCAAARLPAYDERTRTGELRYLVLRRSDLGRVLVIVVARSNTAHAPLTRLAIQLRAERPEVAGVVLEVNATTGGALFAVDGEEHVLAGAGTLVDTVGGIPLQLSARAFFQVDREQAARLYAAVAAAAGAAPGVRLIDLYCGVGGISLTLARAGATVVGVEAFGDAVDDARRSAAAAGLTAQARFEVGDVAAARLTDVDGVIVNPPRKGLSAAARAAVIALAAPRLIYVSCGPESLGRDLAAFVTAGWRITRVTPYDLLPGTPHIETLVTLQRAR